MAPPFRLSQTKENQVAFERIYEDVNAGITPFFRYQVIENIPQSELRGEPVMETHEVVEIRIAGDKNFAPVKLVTEMWKRDGHLIRTYAERWPEQYAAFLSGTAQEASGTPLEMLKPYGMSDAGLSLCRALKIYSIEALYSLQGQAVKNLGMQGNALKEMADKYMADRAKGTDTERELAALRAEIAALKAGGVPAVVEPLPDAEPSDTELKDRIEALVGARPRGNPSRDTLERMLAEAEAAGQ